MPDYEVYINHVTEGTTLKFKSPLNDNWTIDSITATGWCVMWRVKRRVYEDNKPDATIFSDKDKAMDTYARLLMGIPPEED